LLHEALDADDTPTLPNFPFGQGCPEHDDDPSEPMNNPLGQSLQDPCPVKF
jgi:hypothetical protein